jgi:hypothetical protein
VRVAIHQPNYLPWCGYWAKLLACEMFVFLDDAQMPGGQSYVYRTQLRNREMPFWLSIPIRRSLSSAIRDVRFADQKWAFRHLQTFQAHYGRAPFFPEVMSLCAGVYANPGELLADFNIRLMRLVAEYLGIQCEFIRSSDVDAHGRGDDRLIEICRRVGGTTYLSGKGGQKYQDAAKFAEAGIELQILLYTPRPYPQGRHPFVGGLSIMDALFVLGPAAKGLLEGCPRAGVNKESV